MDIDALAVLEDQGEKAARVAICIATFRRPQMLQELLGSIGQLQFPRLGRTPDISIVVVDNDDTGSGRSVIDEMAKQVNLPIHYSIEPVRNISCARNRTVAVALEMGAELLAFVDDDETVEPEWLDSLISVRNRHEANVVFGPVRSRFRANAPPWVSEGQFFGSARYPSGAVVTVGNTCNALVDAGLIAKMDSGFDPRFGLSGGGDTHFFMRARQAGARLVWADDAWVEETVPTSRANGRWILRRAYRIGFAYVACKQDLLPLRAWILPTLGGAIARIGVGLVLLPVGLLSGRRGIVSALRKVAHGLGTLAGLGGLEFEEYDRVHGS